MSQPYEQYDRDNHPIKCAGGSDETPCYRRPELTLRVIGTGLWLGTICGPCAAELIQAGKARRSPDIAFRIEMF